MKATTAGAALAPPVVLTVGKGKKARVYRLGGPGIVETDAKAARETLRSFADAARGAIGGSWRVSASETAAGVAVEATRKAGGLVLRAQAEGSIGEPRRWRYTWSATRTAKKGIEEERQAGTASSWEGAQSEAARAAMLLEGAVCGERALMKGGKNADPQKARMQLRVAASRPKDSPSPAAGPAPAPKAKKSTAPAGPVPSLFGGR